MKLQDLPLATPQEVATARGEGKPEDGLSSLVAGLTESLGRGGNNSGGGLRAGGLTRGTHRPLEEAFVREGEGGGGGLKLKGFVQEDFGVVFDEVCLFASIRWLVVAHPNNGSRSQPRLHCSNGIEGCTAGEKEEMGGGGPLDTETRMRVKRGNVLQPRLKAGGENHTNVA